MARLTRWLAGERKGTPTDRRVRLRLQALEDRQAPAVNWQSLGPAPDVTSDGSNVSGLVRAIAYSPDYDGQGDAAVFLGSQGGGIWRSTDFDAQAKPTWVNLGLDAKSWLSPTGDGAPGLTGTNGDLGTGATFVFSLAVDPARFNRIYAGTRAGLMVSDDGGTSWKVLTRGPNNVFQSASINKIVVDPTNSNRILLAVSDSGTVTNTRQDGIWEELLDPAVTPAQGGPKELQPPQRILGTGNPAQVKDPGGVHINVLDPNATDLDFTLTTVNGQPKLTWYAGIVGGQDRTFSGVWKGQQAANGTWTWRQTTNIDTSWTVGNSSYEIDRIALAASAKLLPNQDLVYAAVDYRRYAGQGPLHKFGKIYKSLNGQNWASLLGLTAMRVVGEQGWHDLYLALSPVSPDPQWPNDFAGRLYIGGQYGVGEYDPTTRISIPIVAPADKVHLDHQAAVVLPNGQVQG